MRWPHGDPCDVIRAIVADPRYVLTSAAQPVQHSWLDDARAWAGRLLRGLFHSLDRALTARNPLDAAVGFAVIAVALAVLVYASFRLVRAYRRRPPRRTFEPSHEVHSAGARGAAELRLAARGAARAGRYRDAAALLFLSAISALDEGGRIAYDPARTPGEYRRIVSDPLFDPLAADVVIALFAATEPRSDLFERMDGAYDRFFERRVS